ncbi:PilZ domain-containing protein [Phaeospirillum tilakii]|uniref:PilZ domain-containing protein n=1 Tax=Phaeospirillum tilakii TaxID=741673 RepID=A0ABW5CBM5_9PROT
MTDFIERRQHPRLPGHGLVVVVGRQMFPIANLSIAGLAFQGGPNHQVGDTLRIRIARIDAPEDCVNAVVTVRAADEFMVRGEFHPTLPLMSYIVAHLGDISGIAPTYPAFRRATGPRTSRVP